MRPGWNPGRRNRHVGTGAHGHGADNRLVIPEWDGKLFYERLESPVVVERRIHDLTLTFLVEAPRPGWFHPCSVDDVCHLLAHLPPEDVTATFVVMRQPTRKQRVLSCVWGRASFWFRSRGIEGTAIVLEAQTDAPLS